jgi:hypothetical protein
MDKLMIFRSAVLCVLMLVSSQCAVSGQEWVRAMFEENSTDLGTVPRGAKAEYAFKLVNKYEEDVHIASVRSSCGCTIPRIAKADLKTYEESAIICELNTRSFIGAKAAVVTVVFSKPFYGEMQLNIKGNIRSDIVTEPGEIQFGEVPSGAPRSTAVKVTYAGRNQWEIVDVRSANQNLGVTLEKKSDATGRIEYEMQVRLKETAPEGEFSDQIVLVTNDNQFNLVTVPVRGSIIPPLVMPVSVELGTVKLGQKVSQRMVIKGNEEFEVTKIECADARFTFTPATGKKSKLHIIPIEFKSETDKGAFRQTVSVHTSLGDGSVATTTVTGNVIAE